MKLTKKITALVLALMLAAAGTVMVFAETFFISDGFRYYYADDGGIYIKNLTEPKVSLTFPAAIDGNPVTGVAYVAFTGDQTLESVDFSGAAYLSVIGSCAFENCRSLRTVTLGTAVKYIYSRAFYGCTALESVTIPNNVTNIADDAFDNCPNLTIYCYSGSYAQTYAEEKGINYILLSYAAGDVNMDGVVNVRDVTEIQKIVAKLTEPTATQAYLADVDKSGVVDIADATLLQKYIARLVDALP